MSQKELILDNNVTVTLVMLVQELTYNGLLEGFPNETMNQRIIQQNESQAAKLLYEPVIITLPPTVKTAAEGPVSAFGAYQKLPEVCCMALLKCHSTFKDKSKDYAALGVVWYQDEFAFPIANNILTELKKVPFQQYCSEYEY